MVVQLTPLQHAASKKLSSLSTFMVREILVTLFFATFFPQLFLLCRSVAMNLIVSLLHLLASLWHSNPRVNSGASWVWNLEQVLIGRHSNFFLCKHPPHFCMFELEHPRHSIQLEVCTHFKLCFNQPTSSTNLLRGYIKLLLSNRQQPLFCSTCQCRYHMMWY